MRSPLLFVSALVLLLAAVMVSAQEINTPGGYRATFAGQSSPTTAHSDDAIAVRSRIVRVP